MNLKLWLIFIALSIAGCLLFGASGTEYSARTKRYVNDRFIAGSTWHLDDHDLLGRGGMGFYHGDYRVTIVFKRQPPLDSLSASTLAEHTIKNYSFYNYRNAIALDANDVIVDIANLDPSHSYRVTLSLTEIDTSARHRQQWVLSPITE